MSDFETKSLAARDQVPAELRLYWERRGLLPKSAVWERLPGGRSNRVWRVSKGAIRLICKAYRPETATPLFPNRPEAEAAALTSLAGTGLAPKFVAQGSCNGQVSLLMSNVEGMHWRGGDPAPVARALAVLHGVKPPSGLPRSLTGPDRLLAQGRALASPALPPPPVLPGMPVAPAAFLHGDPVAGNILIANDGATLIDWQCPAIGEVCDDLALFLSPAMQAVGGNRPLNAAQVSAFFAAYGDPRAELRYRQLAPAYHWRMAAYCAWKARRGDGAYGDTARLELDALNASETGG